MDTRGIQNVDEEDIQEVEGSWGSLQVFQGAAKGWNNTNNTAMSQDFSWECAVGTSREGSLS